LYVQVLQIACALARCDGRLLKNRCVRPLHGALFCHDISRRGTVRRGVRRVGCSRHCCMLCSCFWLRLRHRGSACQTRETVRDVFRWVKAPKCCYVSCGSLVRLGNLVAVRCSFQVPRVICICNKFQAGLLRRVIRAVRPQVVRCVLWLVPLLWRLRTTNLRSCSFHISHFF